jgi:plastocyanin
MPDRPGWLPALLSLLILASLTLLSGCTAGTVPQSPATVTQIPAALSGGGEVQIHNFGFSPETAKIKAGSSVTWVNMDRATHSIISDDEDPAPFATAPLINGAAQPIVLTEPGTYTYHCQIHPSMKGMVIVVP